MRIMKLAVLAVPIFSLLIAIGPASSHADEKASRAREVVAVVNGEEIYLDELEGSIVARHKGMTGEAPVARVDYEAVLNRLINSRLVVQEALDVGLDERPEIKEKVQRFADRTLAKMLQGKVLKDTIADEDDIERIYRDEVRRWKFRAISFGDLDQAGAFRSEMIGGGDFEDVGEKYVKEGLAVWVGQEQEVREAEIAPEISAAFLGSKTGTTTQVIQAAGRFFVFKLIGVSYPEDPALRKRAARKALKLKREKVIQAYTGELFKKYATVNREVLESIGKGDFTDIKEDKRTVAEIPGEAPVLVADLLYHLQGEFYHGGRESEHREALTSDAEAVLREALEETLYLKEARHLGMERTEPYLEAVKGYERSLVFSMYMEQFLVPQARLTDEEVRSEYETRTDEYLMPQTVKVQSLTFDDEKSAQKALASLGKGADLNWLSRNTRGVKGDGITDEELTLKSLPQELQAQLTGAASGDTALYESEPGTYKVIIVRDYPPRAREPFEKVRPSIAKKLFGERLNQVIDDLAAELRKLSEITIFKEKLDKGPPPQDRGEN